ncbi:MAG: cytochrome ubiquinol oxidase subunit I, partial [Gammaproteobacteria bacterium]
PTLEWSIPSPPPHYNFAEIPKVTSRDPLWPRSAQEVQAMATGEAEPHMPSPSAWPVLTALAMSTTWILVMTGVWWVPLIGLALTAICVYGWAFQPAFRPQAT